MRLWLESATARDMRLFDPCAVIPNNIGVLKSSKSPYFLHYGFQLVLASILQLIEALLTERNFLHSVVLSINMIGDMVYLPKGSAAKDFELGELD